ECGVSYATRCDWTAAGADRVDLGAASLDTAATVVLNGRRIAEVQNQHRSWRFDVTDALVEGENELEIRFASPLRTAREKEKVLGAKIGRASCRERVEVAEGGDAVKRERKEREKKMERRRG